MKNKYVLLVTSILVFYVLTGCSKSVLDGNEIYKSNDAETGKFKLTIPETKKYKFTVTGKNAKER